MKIQIDNLLHLVKFHELINSGKRFKTVWEMKENITTKQE